MVKIVSRKSLGLQPVYDIGVAQDHNFLLRNGLAASNCFNKSHSTAYAYVTYQTAYLKANYPVEYMSALLTASSDSQDKIERYRESCQKMGIEVLPPDINRSGKHFKPVNGNILFGLSAVKNLGESAIDVILNARDEEEGKFQSFADFCLKVDLRIVNRRAIETLILCGAFDCVQMNRNQLIHDIDVVTSWAQQRNKDKESGQMNLFDLMGGGSESDSSSEKEQTFDQIPSAPAVPDFTLAEKLKLEKEHIGYYISDHPLKAVHQSASILSPINLQDLPELKSRKKVSAVVILTAVKKITTKKGMPMAFLSLEDISGQAEAVVFPDTFERVEMLLEMDKSVILWGKVDRRDDKTQLIVEDLEPIESVKMVMVNLSAQEAMNSSKQTSLKQILRSQTQENVKGKIPVIATIGKGTERQFVRLGEDYWVQDENRSVEALMRAGFVANAQPLVYQEG